MTDLRIHLGGWDSLRSQARAVRTAVFVVEQKIPLHLEQDEMDPVCLHAVAIDADGQPVGTGRLLPDGHLGRMAVLAHVRHGGIGAALLQALTEAAHARGDRAVVLNAQINAEKFYLRHGFVRDGAPFVEAGIVHVCMRRESLDSSGQGL